MLITIQQAFKYAVDDTSVSDEIRSYCMQTFGCVRKLQNLELDWLYNIKLPSMGYVSGPLEKISLPEVTYFSNNPEYAYLKDVDSLALANAKIATANSIKKFREQKDHTTYHKSAVLRAQRGEGELSPKDLKGMPRFKSRAKGDFSFTTNNQLAKTSGGKDTIHFTENGCLHLPKMKKGTGIKLVMHRPLPKGAVIKNVTVSMNTQGKLFVSINAAYQIDMDMQFREAVIAGDAFFMDQLTFLGLDYAQKDFYVDSNGKTANCPHYYRKSEERMAKLQRQLSRMQKGSENYKRKQKEIARLHEHIANERKDFCQQLSTRLVRQYDVIVVEDIDLRSMGQALSLGKNLHDNGFGMFRTMLSYKLAAKGTCLVKVSKTFASTKTCHCCRHKNPDVTLGVQEWDCPNCGAHLSRDENAAINIREEGKRIFPEYFREWLQKEAEAKARAQKLHESRSRKGRVQKKQKPAA